MAKKPKLNIVDGTWLALNKSGKYEIRWSEKSVGRTRSRSFSCGTSDAKLAQEFWRDWLVSRSKNNSSSGAGEMRVRDLIDEYLRRHVGAMRKTNSQMWSLRGAFSLLGGLNCADLSSVDLDRYTTTRRAACVKDATIRRELGALRACFSWGIKVKLLPQNQVPYFALPPEGAPRKTYLPETSEKALWNWCAAQVLNSTSRKRIGLFICLALEAPARSSAIEHLTWARVDLRNLIVDYRDPNLPVTKKRRVAIPISDRLKPVLEAALLWCSAEWESSAVGARLCTQEAYVNYISAKGVNYIDFEAWRTQRFEDWLGPKYVLGHSGSTRSAWEVLRLEMNIPHVNRHDLRRTWGTLNAQHGVSIFDVAGVLGDSVETTFRNYAHHSAAHLRGAMNARLGGGKAVP